MLFKTPMMLLLLLLLLRMDLRLNLRRLLQLFLRRSHQSVVGIVQIPDVRADHFANVSVDDGQVARQFFRQVSRQIVG